MAVKKRGAHWHYDFSINKRRYRGPLPGATTKQQAAKMEAQVRLSVHEGRYGQPEKATTFSAFVSEVYLPWSKLNKRSARNDVGYCRVLCESFGTRPLDEITPFLIEQFKRKRTESPTRNGNRRAAATINRELACLSKILSLAIDHNLLTVNPCKRVKRVGGEVARNRYLSLDEETRLLAACTGRIAHLRDLVVLAIQTGMRRGEILGLQWAHVDFERKVLYVHRSKSGKPRSIPMSDQVYQVLYGRETSSTWVFTHPYHPTERLTEFKRAWDTACTRASLTDLRFHDLRHTAATRLAECGVEAFTIAGILGHSSIQTSARYAHASDAGKRRAVDFLADYGKSVTKMAQNKKSGTF
ncbi:MAG: site-specific integrase [Blastocatellia bacterium]|nr:site-specific integrase [Blastocatellia bacterium]